MSSFIPPGASYGPHDHVNRQCDRYAHESFVHRNVHEARYGYGPHHPDGLHEIGSVLREVSALKLMHQLAVLGKNIIHNNAVGLEATVLTFPLPGSKFFRPMIVLRLYLKLSSLCSLY
jgi:hypothetical protein